MEKYRKKIVINSREYLVCDTERAAEDANFAFNKLPYCLKILFDNTLRNFGDQEEIESFTKWVRRGFANTSVKYKPNRILMQDFTGVPALVDIAALRNALYKLSHDPEKINPVIPVDLVVDHSLQVNFTREKKAIEKNIQHEINFNKERYEFLKWGEQSFKNFRLIPPGNGICHQINLEYLAKVVWVNDSTNPPLLYPDFLIGTDSHTTMINALSVLGWGVGGIEAEIAMLGEPISVILPSVTGVKLLGKIDIGVTTTDVVLTITNLLRKNNVTGHFIEFFGPALDNLTVPERATISNMAPEYGATCAFFPIDRQTIDYLRLTGRNEEHIHIVEEYAKLQKLWRTSEIEPAYNKVIEINLSEIVPSIAGPSRPQDLIYLKNMQNSAYRTLPRFGGKINDINKTRTISDMESGDIVIAAITSCTNTSNPLVMIAAGLLAKKACQLGLKVKPWVKTSLAPGSKVVTEYLANTNLLDYLKILGFDVVGYGCTTCIGNSGPLNTGVEEIVKEKKLIVASILSGNRNFEARIHPLARINYLASPPLIVAYAIAGSINIDLIKDPIGFCNDEKPIYLSDIWPSEDQIKKYMDFAISKDIFIKQYSNIFIGEQNWQQIKSKKTTLFNWDNNSIYINKPPYFDNVTAQELEENKSKIRDINDAAVLAVFGDSITTDHISPAGQISPNSPAGLFLLSHNIAPEFFNSYGSYRGNHEIMTRATFANIQIKNQLCASTEGGFTFNKLSNKIETIYDTAMEYRKHGIESIVLAGNAYGTGSSRDWAAKGPSLLGVRAVIAKSFERIHRLNLIGMGIFPFTFCNNICPSSLELSGVETVSIKGLDKAIEPYKKFQCFVKKNGNMLYLLDVELQLYSNDEIDYLHHGGILNVALSKMYKKLSYEIK